ncbi:unnamed protein product [Caenorhabditis bovis]|uniref:Uncharacterized protein n=1 Tax=Caenorhabditis bovis TaxID=2654633 RepID=A0A8S1EZ01_9PELO|nr:unnamed protein product [Caenorhabditis bovis]
MMPSFQPYENLKKTDVEDGTTMKLDDTQPKVSLVSDVVNEIDAYMANPKPRFTIFVKFLGYCLILACLYSGLVNPAVRSSIDFLDAAEMMTSSSAANFSGINLMHVHIAKLRLYQFLGLNCWIILTMVMAILSAILVGDNINETAGFANPFRIVDCLVIIVIGLQLVVQSVLASQLLTVVPNALHSAALMASDDDVLIFEASLNCRIDNEEMKWALTPGLRDSCQSVYRSLQISPYAICAVAFYVLAVGAYVAYSYHIHWSKHMSTTIIAASPAIQKILKNGLTYERRPRRERVVIGGIFNQLAIAQKIKIVLFTVIIMATLICYMISVESVALLTHAMTKALFIESINFLEFTKIRIAQDYMAMIVASAFWFLVGISASSIIGYIILIDLHRDNSRMTTRPYLLAFVDLMIMIVPLKLMASRVMGSDFYANQMPVFNEGIMIAQNYESNITTAYMHCNLSNKGPLVWRSTWNPNDRDSFQENYCSSVIAQRIFPDSPLAFCIVFIVFWYSFFALRCEWRHRCQLLMACRIRRPRICVRVPYPEQPEETENPPV